MEAVSLTKQKHNDGSCLTIPQKEKVSVQTIEVRRV